MNYKIAETMNTEAKARNTQFQLTLGDNIYYYGVRNVEDKRFKVCCTLITEYVFLCQLKSIPIA